MFTNCVSICVVSARISKKGIDREILRQAGIHVSAGNKEAP